jgi:hypothetical protein
MATKSTTSSITVTTTPPGDGNAPTITQFEQRARDLMKAFDDIAAILPKVDPGELASDKFIRGHATIPNAFCNTTIVAVEQLPALQALNTLDAAAARELLQMIVAFGPVLDKIDAFRAQVHGVMVVAKAIIGSRSLQTYAIAKGVARTDKTVAAHVANMRRDLKRAGVSKQERDLRTAENLLRKKLKAEKAAAFLKEVHAQTA